ncbi:hypothetical protein FJZ19_00595 [Candidatus Pacearchaeota archaeon]|nr:hypothetical protein [Candidatus Pacearchaeota archaeon]
MAIKKIEFLEDKVVIHQHFNQPSGWPNDSTEEISYDNISKLPLLPAGMSGEEVFVPKYNQTMVLVVKTTREPDTSDGCISHYYDFYLKPQPRNMLKDSQS